MEHTIHKHILDIAFQGNILLFYTRGELTDEKLGTLLDDQQKDTFSAICQKIDRFIRFTYHTAGETTYREIADRLYEINSLMTAEADKLKEHSGSPL